jgi:TRAP-type C4-dicarboxylate transport system permease small subunit
MADCSQSSRLFIEKNTTMIWLGRLANSFGLLGAAVALSMGLMTTVSVITRTLFKAPISGDVEITQMGIALAISLCLPLCQMRAANILVDFFTQRMSRAGTRWLDAAGCLMLAAMYILLSWRTAVGAVAVHAAGETTMIISLPMWWAYACLAPGLALAAVIALVQAWQLVSGRDLQTEASIAQVTP